MPHDLAGAGLPAASRCTACPSGHGTILIVEDNQVNALILSAMLRKHGHEPVVARDGREGVELTCRLRPRLVLMDLHMPRMDGFAAAGEIRRSSGPTPVLIAVTANAGGEVRTACRAAGFACVLAKPIALADLIDLVQRYLDPGESSGTDSGSRIA
jgi:CheY-like chemotaxis protein